ncbi:14525_t:CDS:2 [Entrophospora sp. SA101]|nr:14525_t:CDS:2 [Entrophospora sp. SA101]
MRRVIHFKSHTRLRKGAAKQALTVDNILPLNAMPEESSYSCPIFSEVQLFKHNKPRDVSGSRRFLNLDIVNPATEKDCSHGTEVDCIAK